MLNAFFDLIFIKCYVNREGNFNCLYDVLLSDHTFAFQQF